MDNKINDFFNLNSNKSSNRINSLVGKEIIIHYYPNENKNTFSEAIMSLIKFEGNKLFLGEIEPSDAISLVVDIDDVKGIEECQNQYKIDKEMIGVPVKITNIYDKEIEAVILKNEQDWIFIEFDNQKQSEYSTYLIKNIEKK